MRCKQRHSDDEKLSQNSLQINQVSLFQVMTMYHIPPNPVLNRGKFLLTGIYVYSALGRGILQQD